jgi:hypothetical protein
MIGNEFWTPLEISPSDVVYEDSVYMVIPTPALWREIAKAKLERTLLEYSIVNKRWGAVEGSANTLATAVMTTRSLTEQYNEFIKEDTPNGNVVGFPGKNRPE